MEALPPLPDDSDDAFDVVFFFCSRLANILSGLGGFFFLSPPPPDFFDSILLLPLAVSFNHANV